MLDCIEAIWYEKQTILLNLVNQSLFSDSIRLQLLLILFHSLTDPSPLFSTFLSTQNNFKFLSNQSFLELIIRNTHCTSHYLYEYATALQQEQSSLEVFIPVVFNRLIALQMRIKMGQVVEVNEIVDLLRFLQLPINQLIKIKTREFYESIIDCIEWYVKKLEEEQNAIEVLQLSIQFFQKQLTIDYDENDLIKQIV